MNVANKVKTVKVNILTCVYLGLQKFVVSGKNRNK